MVTKEFIETNQKFRFRLEDRMVVYFASILTFLFSCFLFFFYSTSHIFPIIGIIILALLYVSTCTIIILLNYKERTKDIYYIYNECIFRERQNQVIYKIPLSAIISVRIYNKKGKEGSILLYTNKESLNYYFAFLGMQQMIPLSLFGFTKFKINLASDRKKIVTQIYLANNKLNFIDRM